MTEQRESDAESRRFLARITTLQQLLEVYERSVLEQSEKLLAEQERMRLQKTLLESQGQATLDGILSVSIDGRILFANRRLADMWGIAPPILGAESYDAVLRAMAARTTDPTSFLVMAEKLSPDEESRDEVALADGRTIDRYTAPILSEEGEHFGRVWYFRDVSKEKKLGRMKDDFLSNVAHELRTPLTSVRGSLGLIVGGVLGELPPEAMALIKVAQTNCERLERIIDDIADLQKIEAGRIDLAPRPMELMPLLEQSIELMQAYGEQFGITYQLKDRAPGAKARVDPDRLIQVMANLLSNAAKFSPPNSTVQVALSRMGSAVRVAVTDRGKGIAPEFRGRVFEKFAQAGASNSLRPGGTGLGLNIARAIVEMLGGSIGFESEPGVETSFYFDLPEWRAADGRVSRRG